MIGEVVGSYRIVSRLGQGGMGVVYLAEHPLLKKRAVVKQLLPELSTNDQIVQRFFNEARAATLIQHPGIVDVFDFGYLPNGSAYIIMEFLDGESLATRLEHQRPQPAEAVALFGKQIARAVGAAHGAQIVHRDLKPDNVYLVAEADAPNGIRVKVLDFGIAKLVNNADAGLKTRAGSVMGTPAYMSPEQCNGAVDLDYRADIYALGCILFELITGQPPFPYEGLGEILTAHMHYPPPSPAGINRACPPVLDQLILQMLAKSPAERPASMEIVAQRLEAPMHPVGAVAATIPLPPKTVAAIVHVATPVHPQTTLGGAAAQSAPPPVAPKRSRVGFVVGGVALLAVGAVAIGVASHGSTPAATTGSSGSGSGSGVAAPVAHDRGALETRCKASDAVACGELANVLLAGVGGPARPAEALSLAEAGCGKHEPLACLALATVKRFALAGTSQDVPGALAAAGDACDRGEGLGCALAVRLALVTGDRAAAETRATAAIAKLTPRCATADDAACVALAGILQHATRYAEAAKLLDASCARGDADACIELGRAYQQGIGVAFEPAHGTQLIREIARCDGGRGTACAEQAIELTRDYSSRRNVTPAIAPLTAACEAGYGAACAALAPIYASHEVDTPGPSAVELHQSALALSETRCRGGEVDDCAVATDTIEHHLAKKPALPLKQLGCALGDSGQCATPELAHLQCAAANLAACVVESRALLYDSKREPDHVAGLAIAEDACKKAVAYSCYDAAYATAMGTGRTADPGAARTRFNALCEAGNGPACEGAANMAADAKQLDEATRLVEHGCALGDLPSCRGLAGMKTDKPTHTRALHRACLLGDDAGCD